MKGYELTTKGLKFLKITAALLVLVVTTTVGALVTSLAAEPEKTDDIPMPDDNPVNITMMEPEVKEMEEFTFDDSPIVNEISERIIENIMPRDTIEAFLEASFEEPELEEMIIPESLSFDDEIIIPVFEPEIEEEIEAELKEELEEIEINFDDMNKEELIDLLEELEAINKPPQTTEEVLANFEVKTFRELSEIIIPNNSWPANYEDINEDAKFQLYDVETGRILNFYTGIFGNGHFDIAPVNAEEAEKFHEIAAGHYCFDSRIGIIIHKGVAYLGSYHTAIHSSGPEHFIAKQRTRYIGGTTRAGQPGHVCFHPMGNRRQRQHHRGINGFLENMPAGGYVFYINDEPYEFQIEMHDDVMELILVPNR